MADTKKPAVFLDRDGTIIEDLGHLHSPSEVIFYPAVAEALLRLQEYYLLFIVTNQSGVAKGIINQNDVDRINVHVAATLAEKGIVITDTYVCPHKREDACQCIKPNSYFLEQAAATYNIDLYSSFSIGDHPCDVKLAENVGGKGIYVLTGHGKKHIDELSGNEIIAQDLNAATDIIISNDSKR